MFYHILYSGFCLLPGGLIPCFECLPSWYTVPTSLLVVLFSMLIVSSFIFSCSSFRNSLSSVARKMSVDLIGFQEVMDDAKHILPHVLITLPWQHINNELLKDRKCAKSAWKYMYVMGISQMSHHVTCKNSRWLKKIYIYTVMDDF